MEILGITPEKLFINKEKTELTVDIDKKNILFKVDVNEDSTKRNYVIKVQGDYPNSMYCEMFLEMYDKEYPTLKIDIKKLFDAAKYNIEEAIKKIVDEDNYYLDKHLESLN
tara:strand:+ start:222 stop:554 length:333 start_codon:yes stop_codon:yes gene_type:complete